MARVCDPAGQAGADEGTEETEVTKYDLDELLDSPFHWKDPLTRFGLIFFFLGFLIGLFLGIVLALA